MRAPAGGQERAGSVRKNIVGGIDILTESTPQVQAPSAPPLLRPRSPAHCLHASPAARFRLAEAMRTTLRPKQGRRR